MGALTNEPDGATPLHPDEMEGLRFDHVQTRAELNQLEQVNVQQGLQWLARQKTPDVLSESFARRLHRELFARVWRWAGEFRQTEKNIGVAPEQIAVQFRQLLDNTSYQVQNGVFPPRELALRFHHRLVQIHLFANGNGRHARIMTDALCRHVLAMQPIDWSVGQQDVAGKVRQAYIQALRAADAGDLSPLLTLFASEEER